MSFWKGKKVAVSGAYGFLGPYLCDALLQAGARIEDLSGSVDVFFNLAAHTSGIGSQDHPYAFARNVEISTDLLNRAREMKIGTTVIVSSACVYPESSVHLKESMTGEPIADSRGYAYAKLVSERHGKLLHESGMRVVIARGFNAYGPGDKSDHVIPDLIRKIKGHKPVEIWGGDQIRSFTYATDWVDGLMFLAEHAPSGTPINLAGDEVGIRIDHLAERLIKIMGSDQTLKYTEGPIGHTLRIPDLTWLNDAGWRPKMSLHGGLERTVDWWNETASDRLS